MGRRYRLYPTPGQAERLTGWGHTCRAVWNVALAQRRGLLGVCLDGFSTAPDALDSDRGGTTTPAWSGAPPGPAVPLGKTIQPGEIFGPDAPHHRGDRPAPSATDAPSSRLHPQAHHRPRQTPRLGRNRGPAGEGHDCQCQGHHQAAWEKREGQGGPSWTIPRASGVANWSIRRHCSGRSCCLCRLRPPRRRARHAATGTRRPGRGAEGCSPVRCAGTKRTPTPTPHAISSDSPPDGRWIARAVTLGWRGPQGAECVNQSGVLYEPPGIPLLRQGRTSRLPQHRTPPAGRPPVTSPRPPGC